MPNSGKPEFGWRILRRANLARRGMTGFTDLFAFIKE
jgi:hypothetical protein